MPDAPYYYYFCFIKCAYQNIFIYLETDNLYGYAMSKFLPTTRFKWIDSKDFDLINIPAIVQKDVFSKSILNIQKYYANHIMIIM